MPRERKPKDREERPAEIAGNLLQRRRYEKFLRRRIVLDSKHIGLAADLAVLDVALPAPRGFVHDRCIPLAAARTLKT